MRWWCEAAAARAGQVGEILVVDGMNELSRGRQRRVAGQGTAKATPPGTTIFVPRNEVHSKRCHLPTQTSDHTSWEVCQDGGARMIDWGTRLGWPTSFSGTTRAMRLSVPGILVS